MSRLILPTLAALLLPIAAGAQRAAVGADSARLAQAQQLAASGNGAGGRAVVDSVLAERTEGSPEYAEALYWKALLASNAADAERAYRTLVVEYTTSMRAPDALLRLAQLEDARGDRPGALGHLTRLARDYRAGSADPRAGLWGSRILFDDGDAPSACSVLNLARAGVPSGDVELANQVDYQVQRCVGVDVSLAGTSRGTQRAGKPDSTAARAATADSTRPETATTRAAFSVQVAAYRTRGEAESSVKRFARRGYTARIAGTAAPFRVRIGHFPSRADAATLQKKLKKAKIDAIIVDAESTQPPKSARR